MYIVCSTEVNGTDGFLEDSNGVGLLFALAFLMDPSIFPIPPESIAAEDGEGRKSRR